MPLLQDIPSLKKMARRRGNYRVGKKTLDKAKKRYAANQPPEKKSSSTGRKSSFYAHEFHGSKNGNSVANRPVSPREKIFGKRAHERFQELLARHVALMRATDWTEDFEAAILSMQGMYNKSTWDNLADFKRRRQRVERIPKDTVMSDGPKGIPNLRNTCFRNSVLQSILHVPRILNWLAQTNAEHSGDNRHSYPHLDCLACHLNYLGQAVWGNSYKVTGPSNPITRVHQSTDANLSRTMYPWAGREEQACAYEYLGAVIDKLIRAWPISREDRQLTGPGLFSMRLGWSWTCRWCKMVKTRSEGDNIGIQVCIEPKKENALLDMIDAATKQTIETRCEYCPLLEKCSNEEQPCIALHECSHSKLLGRGPSEDRYQTALIETAPEVLFIHLKRVSSDNFGRPLMRREKIRYPTTLDLSKYFADPDRRQKGNLRYRLSSVIAHKGTIKSGHYITYAQTPKGHVNKINDEIVSQADVEEMSNPADGFLPYILTYVLSPTLPKSPAFQATEAQTDAPTDAQSEEA